MALGVYVQLGVVIPQSHSGLIVRVDGGFPGTGV
jgi:hypothetical protein